VPNIAPIDDNIKQSWWQIMNFVAEINRPCQCSETVTLCAWFGGPRWKILWANTFL